MASKKKQASEKNWANIGCQVKQVVFVMIILDSGGIFEQKFSVGQGFKGAGADLWHFWS